MSETATLIEQLRQTLGKLEIALGSINDAIVWTNESGRIQWCNAPFDALVGRRHLETLGAELSELLPLMDKGQPLPPRSQPWARALAAPERTSGIYESRLGGKTLLLEIEAAGVLFGERQTSAVLVIRNITERKKAETALREAMERAETAYKELEVFSYSVAHDLSAPLRKIDGLSQAVLEDYAGKLDAQGQDFLHRLRKASQNMARLIDALLNLSRVVRQEIRLETVDLSAMAREIASELQEAQPRRPVDFSAAPGLTAKADPLLLRNALGNLLSNAWKFTSGHPRARVEFGAVSDRGRPAYFVRDDGAGFDPSLAVKLFTPFQRLHGLNEFPGTGIGLATAVRIIRRHGGRIWAEGAVEQGATFYFTLQS